MAESITWRLCREGREAAGWGDDPGWGYGRGVSPNSPLRLKGPVLFFAGRLGRLALGPRMVLLFYFRPCGARPEDGWISGGEP